MPLILPGMGSPLVFPMGRASGFDPAHPLSPYATFSGVARNGFGSVRSGVPGVITGSPTSGVSSLGQIVNLTGTAKFTWAGYPTFVTGISTPSVGTIAAIFSFSTNNAANYIVGTTATPGTSGFALSCGTNVTFGDWSQNLVTAAATLTAGVPYFVLASFFYTGNANGDGNQTICIVNLSTGKVVIEATTTAFFFLAQAGGTYSVGPVTGAAKVATTMLAKSYISPEVAAVIAADPWSFWRPMTKRSYVGSSSSLLTLLAGIAAFTQTNVASVFTVTQPGTTASYTEAGNSAPLTISQIATSTPYAETGNASAFGISQTEAPSSYTETGNDAPLTISQTASAASYTETGNASAFVISQTAVPSAYIETGNSAPLTISQTATSTSYTETGNGIVFQNALTAAAQSYTLTGVAVSFITSGNQVLVASQTTYAFSGQDAPLNVAAISAVQNYTLGFVSASLKIAVLPNVQTYTLAGPTVSFAISNNLVLPVSPVSYTFSGVGASLTMSNADSSSMFLLFF